jgi:aldose 1-epimerase
VSVTTGTPSGVREPRIERQEYGALPDGRAVERFALQCGSLEMCAITYGGIITGLRAPDRDGRMDDVVLGHDDLEGYLSHSPYFGALIGRCANRVARGRLVLDGEVHQLGRNDGEHHLHGGHRGFDKAVWTGSAFLAEGEAGVSFIHASKHGDEGYPGALLARVRYTLTSRNQLIVDYHATTDRATVVNLTQHSYFNLGASAQRDVLSHELTINADEYTPVDEALIPTGEIASVEGTPFDFRVPTPIGARIGAREPQLRHAGGYDHNFVLARGPGARDGLRHAARVHDPVSGRVLDVHTSEPGLQFYSGNFLDGSISGKDGRRYAHRSGFCLEPQHYPDAPNHDAFPSIILRPSQEYRSRTTFTFSVNH